MRVLAIKQTTPDPTRQQRPPVSSQARSPYPSITPLSTGAPLLQRQCACGGGCPRCQDKFKLQTKLKMSEPGDKYEQEADRVADAVMRMPMPSSQPQMTLQADQGLGVQRTIQSPTPPTQSVTPPAIAPSLSQSLGSSQPLAPATRAFFEPRFNHDFSQVRIHTDGRAAESAQALQANAYTLGHHIVFNAAHYAPESIEGQRLLAHELTHVIQQSHISPLPSSDLFPKITPAPFILQRQCTGDVGTPAAYASTAAPNLRCDQANTGIQDATARLTGGRSRARVMVDDALTVLDRLLQGTAPSRAQAQFQRVFGGSSPPLNGQIRAVIGIYRSICQWLTSDVAQRGGGILCLTQGFGQCQNGRLLGSAACQTGSTTRRPINLCPEGITPDPLATAETLIHEAAHRFGVCPPAGTRETYEGGRGFPTPAPIQTSADSYNVFAREAHQIRGQERVEAEQEALPERRITTPLRPFP